jgi:alanyl-tRNA synthetase
MIVSQVAEKKRRLPLRGPAFQITAVQFLHLGGKDHRHGSLMMAAFAYPLKLLIIAYLIGTFPFSQNFTDPGKAAKPVFPQKETVYFFRVKFPQGFYRIAAADGKFFSKVISHSVSIPKKTGMGYTAFMKIERAYYTVPQDSLSDPFSAAILEVLPHKEGKALILDKTIFYPEGGGQSADRGTINGVPVVDVLEKDGEVLHLIGGENQGSLSPGDRVELLIDAGRRWDLTVQHSAQHLLSGTILRLTGFFTVSMHLGVTVNTIDVDGPELSGDQLKEAEDAVFSAIEGDHPFIIHHCPPENIDDFPLRKKPPRGEELIRVVEIKDHDFSPCCGTHVSGTGQIGMLRITGAEKYKGMIRVSFIAGRRCLEESRMLAANALQISRALKVPAEETGKAALALLERANKLERDLKSFEEEAARAGAEGLIAKAGLEGAGPEKTYAQSFPGAGMEELLRLGKQAQKNTGAVLVLGSEKDGKFAALCSAKGADIRPGIKEKMEQSGGKGGGGPSFFQGQFDSAEALRAFIAAFPSCVIGE